MDILYKSLLCNLIFFLSVCCYCQTPLAIDGAESSLNANQIDPTVFAGSTSLTQDDTWTDPRYIIFGKRGVEWTNEDFDLLERSIKSQMELEREEAIDRMRRFQIKTPLEQESVFQMRKRYYDQAISLIPHFKTLTERARSKLIKKQQEKDAIKNSHDIEATKPQSPLAIDGEKSNLNANKIDLTDIADKILLMQIMMIEDNWTNPKRLFFGKPGVEWTNEDFDLLERSIKSQLALELEETIDRMRRFQIKTPLEQEHIFQYKKRHYDKVISLIPHLKILTKDTRNKLIEQQQKKDEIKNSHNIEATKPQSISSETISQADNQNEESKIKEYKTSGTRDSEESRYWLIAPIVAGWFVKMLWERYLNSSEAEFICPECNSKKIDYSEPEEVGKSWQRNVMVTERLSSGKSRTISKKATYIKHKYSLKCKKCGYAWESTVEEEK